MRLKRLEIYGFKSFADRTVIEFDAGITAILGPNGSGKSNVSDAVRWVLGEQSARLLRGGKMEDVIFNGTARRKALSYCEVTLLFDNEDGLLPFPYAEVAVTRRMYRSGESEYLLNKTPCRLKDVIDAFRDTGIGREGYSVVGQGRVDEVLSVKSEERRSAFEEAAGVAKFKARKTEAERKLEHTRSNIARIHDIQLELGMQIGPLEAQSEAAHRFLVLRDTLRDVEVNAFILQYERNAERLAAWKDDLARSEEVHAQLQADMASREGDCVALETAREEREAQCRALRETILAETANLEKNAGERKALEARILFLEQDIARLQEERRQEEARLSQLSGEDVDEVRAAQWKKETLDTLRADLARQEEEAGRMGEQLAQWEAQMEGAKARMMRAMNSLSDVRARAAHLDTYSATIGERLAALERVENGALSLGETQKKESEEARAQLAALETARTARAQERDAYVRIANERQAQLAAVSEEIQRKTSYMQGQKSRLHVLHELKRDYEGFYDSVRRVLQACGQDAAMRARVRGVVAELMHVPETYEKAIEMALGAAMQHIVTPTENDAKDVIAFLRKNQYGRATFLPINAVRSRVLNEAERRTLSMRGVVGVASELIEFEAPHRAIFESLLGRTVLAEDIDCGIALSRANANAFRIVTLSGDVLHAGGSITGGSVQSKFSNLLGREREMEKLQDAVRRSEEDIRGNSVKRSALKDEREEALGAVSRLEEMVHSLDMQLASAKERAEIMGERDAEKQAAREKTALEKEQLLETLSDIEEEKKQIALRRQEVEESSQLDNSSVEKVQEQFQQLRREREEMQAKLTEAKVKCAAMEQEHTALLAAGAVREKMLSAHREAIEAKAARMALQQEALDKEKQAVAALSGDHERGGGALEERSNRLVALEKEMEEMDRERRAAYAKREEYAASVAEEREKRSRIEVQAARAETEQESMQERIWNEYELTIETAKRYRRDDISLTRATQEAGALRREMAELGTVNLGAVEEYKRVSERYEFLMHQQEDLVGAETQLLTMIEELEETMEARFREQFRKINDNFQHVFTQLFGGGSAALKLSDEKHALECGIDIIAQPPGKKLQTISLLSGGEKALTAIAILFAMLLLKPTAFCILDEIETSLDEANVHLFANFLRTYAESTQFVVVTHRKGTMEACNALYGIAMEEKGVSRLVSMRLREAEAS